MKNSGVIREIIAAVLTIVLLVLFLNPWQLYMSTSFSMVLTAALVIVFALFIGFVWKERIRDEREGLHRLVAGRNAFLVGAIVLVIGVIVQAFEHDIDPWLVVALALMILAKLVGLVVAEHRH